MENEKKVLHHLNTYANRKEWLSGCVKLFETVKKLQIELAAIDVPEPGEYEGVGGCEKRTKYMFKSIVSKSFKGNSLVFTGIGHTINVWERGYYNKGLLYHFSQKENRKRYEIASVYFPFYNGNSSPIQQASKCLERCGEKTIGMVQKIKIQDIEQAKNFLIKDSKKGDKLDISPQKKRLKAVYMIPKIDPKIGTLFYLKELGAKSIWEDDKYFKCDMPSNILVKATRELLNPDRVKIAKLNKEGINYLKKISAELR
ncbi:MAG: hypothetical protein Tsb005_17820 [Gammaproteobacteria bacterium]